MTSDDNQHSIQRKPIATIVTMEHLETEKGEGVNTNELMIKKPKMEKTEE